MTSAQKNVIFLNYFKIIFAPIIYEFTFFNRVLQVFGFKFSPYLKFQESNEGF